MTNLTTIRFTRLVVVPYSVMEWLGKKGRTPNELRMWLEKMIITYVNFVKEDWGLFFEFSMAVSQMDPNDKKKSILAMEVEPVTVTDPKFWKWVDQRFDSTLGTRPTISVVTIRSGTSHIDKSFWDKSTKVMGISMGEMLWAQKSQQQNTATPNSQAGRRKFYRDWALAALMGYAQVYTVADIQKIWGNFQMSKECADNRQ